MRRLLRYTGRREQQLQRRPRRGAGGTVGEHTNSSTIGLASYGIITIAIESDIVGFPWEHTR